MSERKVGRPKGRRYVSISLSLTREQAEFLSSKPNASALVRQLIDSMREAATLSTEYMRTLELKNRLEELESKLEPLMRQRQTAIFDAARHFKGKYAESGVYGQQWFIDNPDNPEPIDDEGRIALKLRDAAEAEIKRIEQEIAKVRAELLET